MKTKMIKLISLILTFALCLGLVTVSAETETATDTQTVLAEKYEEEIDVLSYLGIIDGNVDLVNAMTRAEFAEMALALGNIPVGTYDYTRFYDITPGTAQCNIVMTAAEAGIVKGGDSSMFAPDKNITVAEAVTMIMRAMGYEDMALLRYNGSSDACVQYARSVKLLKNGTTELLKGGDAVQLMFDALELGYMEISGATTDGGANYTVSETTYLEKVFGLKRCTGVVTGTEYSMKVGGESGYDGVIEIDDAVYTSEISNDYDHKEILGKRVYFYLEEEGELQKVVVIGEMINRNTTVKILPEDMIYGNSSSVRYWDENNKEVTARLSSQALIYYNDALYLKATPEDFDVADGDITLVDNNNDKAYDYVFIREYERYVVSNSSYGVITSLYDDWRFNVKEHENYILYRDGVEITSDHIGRYDEIRVMENKDKTSGIIEASKYTFEGDLKDIRIRDGKTIIKVSNYMEEREFELEEHYVNAYKNGIFGVTEPKKGLSYQFAYNEENRVYAAIEAYDNEYNYGFMIGVAGNGGLDKNYRIKIYGAYGNMKIYNLASNFKVNDRKVEGNEIVNALTRDGKIQQIVMYKTNANNELSEIKTYVDSTATGYNPNNFSLDYKETDSTWICSSNNRLMCGKYRVSPVGEIPCFYIPANRGDDDAYAYYSLYSNIGTIASYASTTDIEVYDTVRYDESTDFSKLSCFVIYERTAPDMPTNPYTVSSVGSGVGQETNFCVVRGIEQVIDQKGDARYQLTYSIYNDAAEYTAYFYDEVYNADTFGIYGEGDKTYLELEKGDIIKFSYKNPYAPIKMIDRFVVYGSVSKYKDLDFYNTYWHRMIDMPANHITGYYTYGKILFYDDEELIVQSIDPFWSEGKERYFGMILASTPTWQYNIKTGEMEYSTSSLLTKGDRIFMCANTLGYQPTYIVRIVEE